MEQFKKIKEVNFSGKFPLQLSNADLKDARAVCIDTQVLRRPSSPYFSNKSNPPNGYLGNFCRVEDGMVLDKNEIVFEKQRFLFLPCTDSQLIPTMLCLRDDVFELLLEIAVKVGVPVIPAIDPYLLKLRPLFPGLSQMLFSCYADTALKVTVQLLKYEICNANGNDIPDPPQPLPPAGFTQIPAGEPVPPSIYAPPPDGSGTNYQPYPGDVPGTPGGGEECLRYIVNYTIVDTSNANFPPITADITVLGQVVGLEKVQNPSAPSSFDIFVVCGGQDGGECLQGSRVIILQGGSVGIEGTINSIVAVP
jgi:hypothetical protein